MKKKILVVDDTSFMVMVITKVLLNENYNVIMASNGEGALRLLQSETPDLILLDTIMDGMSGYEVCEILRNDSRFNLIPIVMLCGQTAEEDKIRGLELGADDYIIKPFNNGELLARIKNCLRRVDRLRSVSPVTGLPTADAVKSEAARRMTAGEPYAALSIKINHFRPYVFSYGFDRGDDMLRKTASVIVESIREAGGADEDMAGQATGSDFVVVTHPGRAADIASRIVARFDKDVLYLYSDVDGIKGRIAVTDKDNRPVETTYPLATVSIGVVVGRDDISYPLDLFERGDRALARARAAGKSAFSE
ncbi:MAG: response regulator [Oscillospiraceae bacterium]|nr:response regulator [Oscillospiraceae bacterium]